MGGELQRGHAHVAASKTGADALPLAARLRQSGGQRAVLGASDVGYARFDLMAYLECLRSCNGDPRELLFRDQPASPSDRTIATVSGGHGSYSLANCAIRKVASLGICASVTSTWRTSPIVYTAIDRSTFPARGSARRRAYVSARPIHRDRAPWPLSQPLAAVAEKVFQVLHEVADGDANRESWRLSLVLTGSTIRRT